jgi:Cellulase (glycosyl hydrolase family 5)
VTVRRVAVALTTALVALAAFAPGPAAAQDDALHRKVLSELDGFSSWLQANDARGFVGEIGWPDQDHDPEYQQWNGLAEDWYDRADAAGLWVGVWATGEWWHDTYKLAAYEDRSEPEGVDSANTQAPVIEAHLSTSSYERGISDAGAEFNGQELEKKSWFSNHDPGRYDRSYHYDNASTFDYIASRGIGLVRIEFRWENLQRRLGGRLYPAELDRLDRAVGAARSAGMNVVLDMHNFGAYYLWNGKLGDDEKGIRRPIGSSKLPIRYFTDVWKRLSSHFGDDPGIYYGLMNEPVGLHGKGDLSAAEVWEKASQAALDAIRANDDDNTVMVSGYRYSPVAAWADIHPDGWITDPAGNFLYEARHYWDRDGSGHYDHTYSEEVQDAADRGF